MNAEARTAPLAASPSELETRIADERRRLLMEQNLQVNLEGQRLAPLEAGDDEALDRVEVQINQCCDRQARIQERIEILERRLVEAQEREREHQLDALAARADRARILGEAAIGEYGRQANALVPLLRRLCAIEKFVEQTNQQLIAAGREAIHSPNAIRCRVPRRFDRTITKRVGIGEREHPHFGQMLSRSNGGDVAYLEGGGQCPTFMEVQVVEHVHETGEWPEPIHEATFLPGIDPPKPDQCSLPLYNGERAEVDENDMRELEAELELEGGALGKITKAATRLLGGKK
jgi:hypothetical protein